MVRFVLFVSLAHLFLLPGYVKLGAINPWQAVGSLFGGGGLWLVMMLSAAAAPFIMGAVAWLLVSLSFRLTSSWISRVRESAFVAISLIAVLSLINAILLADRTVDQNFRGLLVGFVSRNLPVVGTLAVGGGLALLLIMFASTGSRRSLIRFLRPAILVLSPAVLFSVVGILYVLVAATPVESSGGSLSRSNLPPPVSGSPQSVVLLLFDGLSYGVVFRDGEVDERLPNLHALVDQSFVFHNVPSFSSFTVDNVPIMLTGQTYNGIRLDSQGREVAYVEGQSPVLLMQQRNVFDVALDQGYQSAVFGYFLRYCSTYVKDAGYCQSTSADELNSEPFSFFQAALEIYRLTAAKTLPTAIGYRLESMVGNTFLSLIEDRVVELQTALIPVLEDAEGRFIYAHYPIPHNPYVRLDPGSGGLQAAGATYFDSLLVMDFFLGEIRQTLERSGAWEDSLVILLSDHYWPQATSDIRIPLIVKPPRMKDRLDFEGPWTHAQFLPLLETLMQAPTLDSDELLDAVQALAPLEE